MKKNKHNIHRRVILPSILMAFLLLAIASTIAYVSDNSIFNNLFHLKYGETKSIDITPPDNWKRCDTAPKEVTTTNDSTFNIRVRLRYDEFWRDSADENYLPLTHDGEAVAIVNLQNEDDWEDGNDGWMYWKGTLAPGESTRSLLKSVTYNCDTDINTQTICTNTPTGTVCEQPEDPYNGGKFHVFVTVQTTEEKFPEDTYYNVSINPNGGTYNGSSTTYEARVRAGTFIDLSDIERTDFEFRDWTLNDTKTFTDSIIRIESDTTLVANWLSNIFHNVTVDPNGGTYDGKAETSVYSVREGSNYNILDAYRENFAFEGWEYADGTAVSGDSFVVNEDKSIKATWAPAVARIERTGKLYKSIMLAEAEAITDDTITLLVDTEEIVTNEKKVTLDLGTHTVTGSLTNTAEGNLTLINGEINNPNGIAVTNNGTLTIGIDDHKADGTANVDNNYIRLIGTTTGIKQNGVFNFFDGFLEGDVGLEGGYNASPFYHDTFDDKDVYYFPFVDHNWIKDCQHVELASADNAVSKTTVNGDIYYYNLQDNINTSVRTGYKMYAVRNFEASYPLNVAENTSVDFDIIGYDVLFSDTLTVDGTFNIENSDTDSGIITTSQTMAVNDTGTMKMDNVEIQAITSNTLINNDGLVVMRNGSKLSSTQGHIIVITDTKPEFDMDASSYMISTSSNKATVYDNAPELTINNWNIVSTNYHAVDLGSSNVRVNFIGGEVKITGNASYAFYCGNYPYDAIVTIDGGKVVMENMNNGGSTNYNTGLKLKSGEITGTGNGSIYGTYSCNGSFEMSGGEINIKSTSTAYGSRCGTSMTGGTMTVESAGGTAIGVGYYLYASGGTISTKGVNAYGLDLEWANSSSFSGNVSVTVESISTASNTKAAAITGRGYPTISDNATLTAISKNGVAYGVELGMWGAVVVNSGTVSATSTNNAGYGIYTQSSGYNDGNIIDGGTIYGSSYGAYTTSGSTLRIGTDDGTTPSITSPEITGGQYGVGGNYFSFYDGILKGGIKAHQDDVIKAIPDGTLRHLERLAGPDDPEGTPEADRTGYFACWLEEGENYLAIGNKEYNSLTKAYNEVEDGDTIRVIKNASISTTLPTSPSDKSITLDLNGHTLTYSQTMPLAGTVTITDSSATAGSAGTGVLTNSAGNPVIYLSGILNIESGTILATAGNAINAAGGSGIEINLTGGEIKLTDNAAWAVYGTTWPYETNIVINGGKINIENVNNGAAVNYNTSIKLISGEIVGTGDGTIYGPYSCNSSFEMLGGSVNIKSTGTAYGSRCGTHMTGGTMTVESTGGTAIGVSYYLNATGGTLSVKAAGTAYGVELIWASSMSISGDTSITVESTSSASNAKADGIYGQGYPTISENATITTISKNGNAYGIELGTWGAAVVNDGTISATSTDGGVGYGVYTRSSGYGTGNIIDGGTIYGSTYGVYAADNGTIRIGTDDGTTPSITSPDITGGSYGLAGNYFTFYDGILKGGIKAHEDGIIKAIPDGTLRHLERLAGPDDPEGTPEADRTGYFACWLEEGENYLSVNGEEFNSLTKAYNAVTNGGTIKVIKDASIATSLPTSPSNKEIYFDLNGHTLTYSQTMTLANVVTILDSSTAGTGIITNSEGNSVLNVTGTLNVDSGTILATSGRAIGITAKKAKVNLYGGEVKITGDASWGIYDTNGSEFGTVTINGGKINMENLTNGGAGNYNTGVNLISGEIVGTGNGDIYGLYSCSGAAQISGGSIDIKTTGTAYGVRCGTSMSGGTITAESTDGTAVGVGTYLNATGGTISVKGAWNAYGVDFTWSNSLSLSGNVSITVESTSTDAKTKAAVLTGQGYPTIADNATLTAISKAGSAYGIELGTWGAAVVNDGTISATSTDGGVGYGVYTRSSGYGTGNIIDGGTIYGSTYGVYAADNGTIRIGTDDGTTPSITSPDITGGSYGLAGNYFTFYDGILKGKIAAYEEYKIRYIAANSTMYIGTTTIDGDTYHVRYLIPEHDVAQINDTKYTSLADAIDAAQTGDLINLIDDNLIFYSLTIPSTKDVTIETNGYDIIASNPIVNNGKVILKNSSTTNNPSFDYAQSEYFIQNNAGAELTIKNIPLISSKVILNSGKLTLDHVTVTASDVAVSSSGDFTTQNSTTLTGANYAAYVNGGNNSFTGTTFSSPSNSFYQNTATESIISSSTIDGYVANYGGKLSVDNSTVSRAGENIRSFVYTAGSSETTFDTVTATLTHDGLYCHQCTNSSIAINNGGKFTLKDSTLTQSVNTNNSDSQYTIHNVGSEFNIINSTVASTDSSWTSQYRYAIYSTGNMTIENSDVSVSTGQNLYGLYNTDGNITIDDESSLYATGGGTTYGIYNNTGEVTLGIPEPSSSPDYGLDTADVSLTNPDIRALGSTSGIGIKNVSGRINFYDGIITATNTPLAEVPTKVEYLYEPKQFTDSDNNEYVILKWMRAQPTGN